MPGPIQFDILARCPRTQARLGRVGTPHGDFETPAFMPVGTRASIKGVLPHLVRQFGAQIVLNNTYHLMLRPGSELIHRLGGVHRFMNWDGPILTDSGGFQAFSLADTNKVDDDGVTFKSVVDGSTVRLTPERAMEVQNQLGADIIMALDDCPPAESPGEESGAARRAVDHAERLRIANERTIRWLERCRDSHTHSADRALFGIVQGGTDLERRAHSVAQVCNVELPGYAIGGVAVGESSDDIARVVRHTAPLMPDLKPRYLMGVGYERDLLAAVLAGVDMFDCVLPTRNGRNANAFTSTGQIRLRNAVYAEDMRPIEPGCDCPACAPSRHGWASPEGAPFGRAYLRHLFMVGEMLGPILVSLHNLRHFQRFMAEVRGAIAAGAWEGLVARWPTAAAGFPESGGGRGLAAAAV
ncbi:MAG: tRNA guanosine(34) transglycosylase Tgt [Phycisphaerales bacterium]|nr:tRNA guanosine(34) transglycosylase Tgt [Phycisphaerales bacterium]